jgi:VCBS repeat-containing protein
MPGRVRRHGTTPQPTTAPRSRRSRVRAALLLAVGGLALAAGVTAIAQAVTSTEYAATASLTPKLRYIGDPGSVYEFTIKNTGSVSTIGAIEIDRPATWRITSCPTPPAGWTAQASSTKCRFRTAATKADDLKPGQSLVFNAKAWAAGGTVNRNGTWNIIVSRSNEFDHPSLLKYAMPTGTGLVSPLYTWEVTTAVVTDLPKTPGSACPADNKSALAGSTQNIVVCGRNHATVNLTPVVGRSTLKGTFIATKGTFSSGVIAHNSGNVVLANWTGTTVAGTYGTAYKVIAGIGSAANQTSPLRTFTDYSATSHPPVAVDDSGKITNEDTTLSETAPGLLANDTDLDGDTLVPTLAQQAAHGTATVNTDGSWSYVPNADYNGADSFTYTVNDGHTDSAPATVSITVNAVNDAPIASNVTDSTNEDTPKSVSLSATDVDADPLTFSVVTGPAHGSLGSISAASCPSACTSTVTYTPDANYNGPDSFTYKANDGGVDSNTATVNITVNAVNDAPVANADAYGTDEDTPLSVAAPGVLSNDTDVEGDPLTAVLVTGVSHGSLVLDSDGSFTYTPDADYNGPDSFEYKANDGNADSVDATVGVTINAVNDAPVAGNVSTSTNEDTAKGVTLSATDADGDTLTFSVVTGPAHGSLGSIGSPVCAAGSCTASVTYTPDANYNGPDSFTYKANDGGADSNTATVSITVNAVNDAPVATGDAYSTNEDTPLTVSAPGVLNNDTDVEGTPLTAVQVAGTTHGTLTLNADGSFTYTPDADYNGPDSFTYKANDGTADSNIATVSITVNAVNDAPVAANVSDSTNEDTAKTVTLGAADAENTPLTFSIVTGPAHGSLGSVSAATCTIGCSATVQYTPDANYNGPDSFTYKANDGSADSNTATVTMTVNAVNDAPVAAADGTYTTNEDTPVTVTAPGVLANDTDVEGSPLTAVKVTDPAHGTVTLNADGSFTYTPAANYHGADSFTYKANDGSADSNTVAVSFTVTSVADDPVAGDDSANVPEDSTGQTVSVLANDTDGDGDGLTITSVDTTGTTGTVTNNGDDVTYDPNGQFEYLTTGQTATDTFTYTVSDGTGGTDTATVTITIQGSNDPPVAVDDAASTDEATTKLVNVVVNDTDAEGAITVTSVDTTGTSGTVTNNNDGTLTYNPNGQFEALGSGDSDSDTFTYTITDADGATDTATVTITVNGLNDAPVANDDTANVPEDSTGQTVSVVANDTDAESDGLTITSVDTTGTTGSVTNNGDDVTYDPNGQFEYLDTGETATDTFTYTISDGSGGTDTATVTVTITGANDAPVAVDDAYQVLQDTPLHVAAPGVLANDTDADSSDTVTAGNASTPSHGDVTLNADGSFDYTPDSGYTGSDSFTYDAGDGTTTDSATVNLTVAPPNATPTVDATSASGNEDGGPITVTLTGHDADGDPLTFSVASPVGGTLGTPTTPDCSTTPNTCTSTVTFTPNANFAGAGSFTYKANDGTIDSAPANASVTVNPVNDAPSFTKGGDQTVNEDAGPQTVSGWATAISPGGGSDESGQLLTFLTSTNNDGLFSSLPAVNAAGDLSYTPAVDANGSATVTIHLQDNGGTANGGVNDSGNQTFVINVTAVNDPPSFTKGADQTLFEDAGAQSVSNWATAISKGPSDESAQTLNFIVTNDNNGLFSVQPAVSPTGTLTFTSAPNAVGSATVTVSLHDSGGGTDTSPTQTFTITVNGVNDAPTFTMAGDQTVLEDAGPQSVSNFVTSTSPGPSDESAQTVTVSVVSTNNNPLFSSLPSIDSSGTLTYTPAVNANGSATVTVHATDNGGTANGGSDTSGNQTFAINVTAVNDVPSFTKGTDQNLNEDAGAQSVSNWATAISPGPANEAGQTVSFEVTNNTNPSLFTGPGAPAVSPTGTLTYTSAPNLYGTATITLRIKDNGGTANGGVDTSPTQTFTITVNPVNDAPVAAAKAFTVQANMKISLGGLLTGATDPNDVAGDPSWTPTFTLGSITVGASCTGCTVSNVNTGAGTFDFDPPAGGTGTYSVTYTVVDNGFPAPPATSAPQTITFTVNSPVIWFVDASLPVNGSGRLSAPFNNLGSAITAMGTNTNQRIFVRGGNVTGNVVLQTDGWLISEAATGTSFDTVMNITPPAGTIARPAVNGTQRTLTGSVTAGTNSVIRGFDLTPGSGTPGLVASGKNNLTVNQMSATTTNAIAVNVANSQGSTFSFKKVASTGGANGINLVNVNNTTPGSFTVTGTASVADSGGIITTSTGDGIHLDTVTGVTLSWMKVSSSTAFGIWGSNVTTLALADSTFLNNGTNEALDHAGIYMLNLLGTSTMSNLDVSGSRETNVFVRNSSGTGNLTLSNSNIHDNNTSVGANGVAIDTQNTGALTFTSTSNTITHNRTSGLLIFGESSQRMNATVTGGTYTGNGTGMDIAAGCTGGCSGGGGGLQYSVTGGSITGCATCGAGIVVTKGSAFSGTGANALAGTISNMTINQANSEVASAIWLHGAAGGAVRAAVTNNTISNAGLYGIEASFGQSLGGSQAVDLTITGNTVDTVSGASCAPGCALAAILVEAGTTSGDVVAMCADIGSSTNAALKNDATNPDGGDIRVRNVQSGTTFRLPGYGGTATDTTAVQNYLIARNTIADAVAFKGASNPNGFTGGAACAGP